MRLVFKVLCLLLAQTASAEEFSYNPPGDLVAGSGTGYSKNVVFLPNIRFPLESAPAFLNSQVYGAGGFHGGGGGQCDLSNYSYPWRDNFCETRNWSNSLCPTSKGHQGQDIRPATCERNMYWVVAAEAGIVSHIGRYSVSITTPAGRIYRYMHMNMSRLSVSLNEKVEKGVRLGLVSNDFGGTPTTIHLHFDVKSSFVNSSGAGFDYVPPYTSLVAAYKELVE